MEFLYLLALFFLLETEIFECLLLTGGLVQTCANGITTRTYYSNGDLTLNSNSNTLPRQPNRYNDTFNLHKNVINYNGNSMMIPNKRNESGRTHAYAADFYIDNDGHYHANDNINYGMANDANKQQSQTSQQNYYNENSIRSPMLPPIERRSTNRGYVKFIAL